MYCGKCGSLLETESVYEHDTIVNVSCSYRCGKNWELPVNDHGPRGILARYLKRHKLSVTNGV